VSAAHRGFGRVAVGRIRKVFGIRGEVLIEATGDDPDRFAPGVTLYLGEAGPESVTIEDARESQGAWLVRFRSRPDRSAVEDLAGLWVYRESKELPTLGEGEYYHFQLVGLLVTRSDGTPLGRIESILESPGTDLYEVRGAVG